MGLVGCTKFDSVRHHQRQLSSNGNQSASDQKCQAEDEDFVQYQSRHHKSAAKARHAVGPGYVREVDLKGSKALMIEVLEVRNAHLLPDATPFQSYLQPKYPQNIVFMFHFNLKISRSLAKPVSLVWSPNHRDKRTEKLLLSTAWHKWPSHTRSSRPSSKYAATSE